MLKRCWERLALILEYSTPEIAAMISGLSLCGWAAWMILHPDRAYSEPPLYYSPPDTPWLVWPALAAAAASTGLLQLYFAGCGYFGASRYLALVACSLWAFLAFLRAISASSPALAVYLVEAATNGWIWYRLHSLPRKREAADE